MQEQSMRLTVPETTQPFWSAYVLDCWIRNVENRWDGTIVRVATSRIHGRG